MEHKEEHANCPVCGLVPVVALARRSSRVVTQSASMRELLQRAARFADSDAPVVMLGESGTGKELVARVLHGSSRRAPKAFVAVNVAALPAELLESELFGHARGAFTGAHRAHAGLFEEAAGGTLFLDEIAELPLLLQSKLLRALQDGEIRRVGDNRAFGVDVRIICATHRDLAERVRSGAFREDLYYRLKVLTLRVPALRERPEDILPLADQFLLHERRIAHAFSRAAQLRLLAYGWPGNVRELQNAVQHGAALATGHIIEAEHLPEDVLAPPNHSSAPPSEGLCSLAEAERRHIERVLASCGGSQGEAARVLGIGRNTLWRKLRRYAA
ncbi:MAG TPA: sigma-54 dependent transcriptional regulator [Polyangiales bacterium]